MSEHDHDSDSIGDERMRGDDSSDDHRSFNQRLRDRFYGRRPVGETGADEGPAASARPKVNQMGFFGRVQRPGGFDEPPDEPVELDGELPWELGGDKRPES